MRYFLLLVVLSCIASAECTGNISQYVPAIMDDSSGSLVNVSVGLVPGGGQTYVAVWPRTGLMAQESMQQAVAYAYEMTGEEPACDVLIDFGAMPTTSYIEGPSAGTALAVMTYALLENRTMRNDTVITGSVDASGAVGPVGGLYEKASGAARMGASYFITPVENVYDILLLQEIEERYGMNVLQARTVEEVAGFMLDNESIEQEPLAATKREIPDVPYYDSSPLNAFRPVATVMVSMEQAVIGRISGEDDESKAVEEFYGNEAQRQQRLLDRGYLFSAANEAFLNYIEVSTIEVILKGDVDLPRKKGEAGICLSGIKRPVLTDSNFEWVIGADLREAWAQDKLNATEIDDKMLADESYVAYHELMYADAWCRVAKGLVSAAPSGGTAIDENAWKEIAETKIDEARSMDITDNELASRLNIAQESYGKGSYGAAAYDAVYVIENQRSDDAADEEIEENTSILMMESRTSLWGRIYQSHAAYLYAQNETAGAYRTALFAKGLDEATAEMVQAMEPAQNATGNGAIEQPEPQETQDGMIFILGAIALISMLLFIVAVIVFTRRSYGSNGQRPGKAHGAKQKKGRV
jgi:predicted S18 family serine protease